MAVNKATVLILVCFNFLGVFLPAVVGDDDYVFQGMLDQTRQSPFELRLTRGVDTGKICYVFYFLFPLKFD